MEEHFAEIKHYHWKSYLVYFIQRSYAALKYYVNDMVLDAIANRRHGGVIDRLSLQFKFPSAI